MEAREVMTSTKWLIDRAHSEVAFKVKHLMFSNVRGTFKEFDAHVYTRDNDFGSSEISVKINPASIDTGTASRDEHLRSEDFFDVQQFNEIVFKAQMPADVTQQNEFKLSGDLTIKGITRQVELIVEFGTIIKDPWGAEKALFNINGKISRKEWGLNYNSVLETGGVLISDDVWIQCEVQLIKQAS